MAVPIYVSIPITTVGGVTFVICIILIIRIIYEFRQRAKDDTLEPILPFFRYCTLFTMSSFTLSTLTIFVMNLVYMIDNNFYINSFYTITSFIFIFMFVLAKLSLYALLIQRLRVTFLDSIYALKMRSFLFLGFIIVFGICGFCSMQINRVIGLLLGVMFDVILCCSILYLFINRLMHLTVNYHIKNSRKQNKKKGDLSNHKKRRQHHRNGHSHNLPTKKMMHMSIAVNSHSCDMSKILMSSSLKHSSSLRKLSAESDVSDLTLNLQDAVSDEKLPAMQTEKLRINSVSSTQVLSSDDEISINSPKKKHKKRSDYDNQKYKNPKFSDKHNCDDMALTEMEQDVDEDGYHVTTGTVTQTSKQRSLRFRNSVCRTITQKDPTYQPPNHNLTKHHQYGKGKTSVKYCLDDIQLNTTQTQTQSKLHSNNVKESQINEEERIQLKLNLSSTASKSTSNSKSPSNKKIQAPSKSTPTTPTKKTVDHPKNLSGFSNLQIVDTVQEQKNHQQTDCNDNVIVNILKSQEMKQTESDDEEQRNMEQENGFKIIDEPEEEEEEMVFIHGNYNENDMDEMTDDTFQERYTDNECDTDCDDSLQNSNILVKPPKISMRSSSQPTPIPEDDALTPIKSNPKIEMTIPPHRVTVNATANTIDEMSDTDGDRTEKRRMDIVIDSTISKSHSLPKIHHQRHSEPPQKHKTYLSISLHTNDINEINGSKSSEKKSLPELTHSHSMQHLSTTTSGSWDINSNSNINTNNGHKRGRSLSFDPQRNKSKQRNNFGRKSFGASTNSRNGRFNERSSRHFSEPRSRSSTLLNSSQIELIHTMIRSTILSSFAIVSTIIFSLFVGIRFEVHGDISEIQEQHKIEPWVQGLVLFLHDFINCVCIYLNLNFSKELYLKICDCCDFGCEWLGIIWTEKYIQRRRDNEDKENINDNENNINKTNDDNK